MASNTPTGVTANRQTGEVSISWDDGHTSTYSFSLLRLACPCAHCRGGHEFMSSEPDPEVFYLPPIEGAEARLQTLEAVGAYALTIQWEDGHNYGIYNWKFLRTLCPCPECRKEAEDRLADDEG